MAGKILKEIRQNKPFSTVEEEAVLNITRTAEVLGRQMAEFLKGYALSSAQYNILRILRGAGKEGITCSELGDRLVTRDPDVTRLLDRMETRGLVKRERSKEDRRVVVTTIAKDGLDLVNSMDEPLRSLLKGGLGKLKKKDMLELIELLEQVREAVE